MRIMSELLANHINEGHCVVFLDDILIFSDSQGDDERHEKRILGILQTQVFSLKRKKHRLRKLEAEFVAFAVSGEWVHITQEKIQEITGWLMV